MRFLIFTLLFITLCYGSDTVVVATDIWPPFRVEEINGELTGIDIDFMHTLGKSMGITFKFVKYPWIRCLKEMKAGNVDIMSGLAFTADRNEYITYTKKPYYICYPAFFTHKNSDVTIETYKDLYRYQIGITRGSAYFEKFDSDTLLNKYLLHNEESLLTMLYKNRLQAIIGTDTQVAYDLIRLNMDSTIIKQPYIPDSKIELFIGVSRKSPFAKRWDEFVSHYELLLSDSTPQKIGEKYRINTTRH